MLKFSVAEGEGAIKRKIFSWSHPFLPSQRLTTVDYEFACTPED
jgi:hypothetical protein